MVGRRAGEDDWHQPFQEWCIAMEQSLKGFTTLSNLFYDVRERHITGPVLGEILRDVATRWKDEVEKSSNDGGKPKDPHRVFEEAIEEAVNAENRACPENRACLCSAADTRACLCPTGTTAPHAVPEQYSRVMMTRIFREKNFIEKIAGVPIGMPLTRAEVIYLKKRFKISGLLDVTQGFMRGRLPFAWVTKTKVLAELKESTQEPPHADGEPPYADPVRKYLGLSHFKDDRAIEIKYPDGELNGRRFCVPTVLEGLSNPVFQSKTDSDDRWGRAVNLETGDDGFPEAVHEQIEFTRSFDIDDLGRLSPPDWKAEDDQEAKEALLKVLKALLQRLRNLRHPWTSESYRELLEYVL